ncbi:MAG: hypothetical protein H6811_11610 [Phycisphaeraceae bacterium]|nr:hypothetical protein [Phycisphaeraceae bacterium]
MAQFASIVGIIAAALLLGAAILHLIPRLGSPGRTLADALCRAPLLDALICYFTVLPLIAGPILPGVLASDWPPIHWSLGLLAAVLGQIATVLIWTFLHELAHPQARKGPRIVKSINKKVGPLRNHTAVWWTAWAVPVFAVVRFAELTVYPPLTWLVRLPRYRHAQWVNVSRQKFSGLVGHDLIWCLYCDWMTGVWSLASEMLRNVESFWCPIRFASPEKCANCTTDFPDIAGGWVPADGTMHDVASLLDAKYSGPGANAWFGHPVRLTVNGDEP